MKYQLYDRMLSIIVKEYDTKEEADEWLGLLNTLADWFMNKPRYCIKEIE